MCSQLDQSALVFGIALAVLCSPNASVATAQSVQGHGMISNGPGLSPSQISVDAWIDANGVAQGTMSWIGDVGNTAPYGPVGGGPADPFIIEVTYIEFFGNSACVEGVVIASPEGSDANGFFESFTFTDNSGTGEPDEIDGTPIVAGNITVDD